MDGGYSASAWDTAHPYPATDCKGGKLLEDRRSRFRRD